MGDKEIETTILEKEKAKQKYDDAVAQGNTAVNMTYDEELPKVLSLNIGNIPEGEEVQIDTRISTKLSSFKHGQFSLVFPINFIPKIVDPKEFPDFSSLITLRSESEITNMSVSHEEFTHSSSENIHTLEFPQSKKLKRRDIVVSFSHESIRDCNLKFYGSEEHKDEIVAHLS